MPRPCRPRAARGATGARVALPAPGCSIVGGTKVYPFPPDAAPRLAARNRHRRSTRHRAYAFSSEKSSAARQQHTQSAHPPHTVRLHMALRAAAERERRAAHQGAVTACTREPPFLLMVFTLAMVESRVRADDFPAGASDTVSSSAIPRDSAARCSGWCAVQGRASTRSSTIQYSCTCTHTHARARARAQYSTAQHSTVHYGLVQYSSLAWPRLLRTLQACWRARVIYRGSRSALAAVPPAASRHLATCLNLPAPTVVRLMP